MPGSSAREDSPLRDAELRILLVLAGGKNHGYAIMKSIEAAADGRHSVGCATLYRSIKRMLEKDLIAEVEDRPDPQYDDERRRYYRLTRLGRNVLGAEVVRLEGLLAEARKQVWPRASARKSMAPR